MKLLTFAAALAACARGVSVEDSLALLQKGSAGGRRADVDPEPSAPSAAEAEPAAAAAPPADAAQLVSQNSTVKQAAVARGKAKRHGSKNPEANLTAGQTALLRIYIGTLRGRVLPCVVRSRRTNGRYRVRIPTSPLSTDLYNIPGTDLEEFNSSIWSTSFDDLVKSLRENKDLERLTAQAEKEAGLRTRNEVAGRKNITAELIQPTLDKMRRDMEADMLAEVVALGCPSNSVMKVGSGRPQDRVGKNLPTRILGEEKAEKVDTLELCSESCSDMTGCTSFEWSPVRKTCLMFKTALPGWTKSARGDTIFCSVAEAK